jgi:hypothetical protein
MHGRVRVQEEILLFKPVQVQVLILTATRTSTGNDEANTPRFIKERKITITSTA